MENKIGETIEVKPILDRHNGEMGCGTSSKVCEYLNCQLGEQYILFNDKDNPYKGTLCKIKQDIFNSCTLCAFDGYDDEYGKAYKDDNCAGNGNHIVYLSHHKYIMRVK